MGNGCIQTKPTAPALTQAANGSLLVPSTTFPSMSFTSTSSTVSTGMISPSIDPLGVIGSVKVSSFRFVPFIVRLDSSTSHPMNVNSSRCGSLNSFSSNNPRMYSAALLFSSEPANLPPYSSQRVVRVVMALVLL